MGLGWHYRCRIGIRDNFNRCTWNLELTMNLFNILFNNKTTPSTVEMEEPIEIDLSINLEALKKTAVEVYQLARDKAFEDALKTEIGKALFVLVNSDEALDHTLCAAALWSKLSYLSYDEKEQVLGYAGSLEANAISDTSMNRAMHEHIMEKYPKAVFHQDIYSGRLVYHYSTSISVNDLVDKLFELLTESNNG